MVFECDLEYCFVFGARTMFMYFYKIQVTSYEHHASLIHRRKIVEICISVHFELFELLLSIELAGLSFRCANINT